MDHGEIISKLECQISNDDTYESLSKKLAEIGSELLIKTVPDYISGKIKPVEQDQAKAIDPEKTVIAYLNDAHPKET